MIDLDLMRSPDGRVSIPAWKVRSVAEEMAGPIVRQTWSDWCRRLNQSGRGTAWIDIGAASTLVAMAYLASRGVRCYSGEIFEAAIVQGRRYWENYAGEST